MRRLVTGIASLVIIATVLWKTIPPVMQSKVKMEHGGVSFIKMNHNQGCCSISAESTLEILCRNITSANVRASNCICADYMMCKLVLVTALSSNHYEEAQDFFSSAQANMPNTKIIAYDLGLKNEEFKMLQSYCNVEMRKFNFSRYPNHTKNLRTYAWKPFIANEISRKHELFSYCDASVRIKRSMDILFPFLNEFPFFPGSLVGNHIVQYTHDGMMKYLHINSSRAELAPYRTIQGGLYVMWVTNFTRERILSHWIDCAEHSECISPKGAHLSGCDSSGKHSAGEYIGCHRYDQSALNMILIREFGDLAPLFEREKSSRKSVFTVQRTRSKNYQPKVLNCTTSAGLS